MIAARKEGLGLGRFLMVLSSISPLFALWAIRGTKLFSNCLFASCCAFLIIIPNAYIFVRLWVSKRNNERRPVIVGKSEDHRDHLLVYLFAMLLPFYTTSLNDWREFSATIVAVSFIVFLFWNLNLHYMNVLFAVLGYRIFTVFPVEDGNPLSGTIPVVLVTRRAAIPQGVEIRPYRLSSSVFWEG